MNILDVSILFTRASNVRTQLDYISGHDNVSGDDLIIFNNLIRVLDKIYMSDNTRAHRTDLQNFILFNADAIYTKYVELTKSVLSGDSYADVHNAGYELNEKIQI
jgi:hypothetical protein